MRWLALVVALVACGDDAPTKHDGGTLDDGTTQMPDGDGSGSTGGSTSIDGQAISCYTQGNPTATCTLPTHCCFSNFSAQHDGFCEASECAWGTIECDGPEDCTSGGHCCSHQLTDSNGLIGYRVACQAAACGASPANEELCHGNGPACANGGTCITAFGNNNDLPRSLSICR